MSDHETFGKMASFTAKDSYLKSGVEEKNHFHCVLSTVHRGLCAAKEPIDTARVTSRKTTEELKCLSEWKTLKFKLMFIMLS